MRKLSVVGVVVEGERRRVRAGGESEVKDFRNGLREKGRAAKNPVDAKSREAKNVDGGCG